MTYQVPLGLALVKNGALQLTTGFIWGVLIPFPPYPRIALSAHMNIIQHGLLSIAAGYIIQDGLAHYSNWQLYIISGAHFGLWALDIISLVNSWWGTNRSFKMVCSRAFGSGLIIVGEGG
jgi:hydroxylaminobenzene mutase